MKHLALTATLLTLIPSAIAGDIEGQATLTKRISKRKLSPVVYDLRGTAARAAASSEEPVSEFDRMVVIIEGGKPSSQPPITATLNQRDARFDPDVLVVPVGSSVQFPNFDPIFHNVFSLSKAQPFDLGYYRQGQSRTVKFDRPGIVQVYCHIHSNMYAAIVVTASPWYTKPNPDGRFSFKGIPAGHYSVTAWHNLAGIYKVEVDVPETGAVAAKIRVPLDTEQRR